MVLDHTCVDRTVVVLVHPPSLPFHCLGGIVVEASLAFDLGASSVVQQFVVAVADDDFVVGAVYPLWLDPYLNSFVVVCAFVGRTFSAFCLVALSDFCTGHVSSLCLVGYWEFLVQLKL